MPTRANNKTTNIVYTNLMFSPFPVSFTLAASAMGTPTKSEPLQKLLLSSKRHVVGLVDMNSNENCDDCKNFLSSCFVDRLITSRDLSCKDLPIGVRMLLVHFFHFFLGGFLGCGEARVRKNHELLVQEESSCQPSTYLLIRIIQRHSPKQMCHPFSRNVNDCPPVTGAQNCTHGSCSIIERFGVCCLGKKSKHLHTFFFPDGNERIHLRSCKKFRPLQLINGCCCGLSFGAR